MDKNSSVDWKKFKSKIRYLPSIENWSDPDFVEPAEFLVSTSRSKQRSLLYCEPYCGAYLELIRMDWGYSAAYEAGLEMVAETSDPEGLSGAILYTSEASGMHHKAVTLLRSLEQRFPSNPVVKLRLAQALASNGQFPEIDLLAERVLSLGKIGKWTANQWASLLVNIQNLERGSSFLNILTDMGLSTAQLKLRLESFREAKCADPISSSILNLDREPRKLAVSQKLLPGGGIFPKRISAVDGRQLPEFALLSGSNYRVLSSLGPGVIGTAFSHIKVWEDLVRSNDEYRLVLEDDAIPYVHWGSLESLIENSLSSELVWVNDRMSAIHGARIQADESGVWQPWDALGDLGSSASGVGTDGYIISRSGAEKLLGAFSEDGILGHVDWQLAAYSIAVDSGSSKRQGMLRRMRAVLGREEPVIQSKALTTPLIYEWDHGASTTVKDPNHRPN